MQGEIYTSDIYEHYLHEMYDLTAGHPHTLHHQIPKSFDIIGQPIFSLTVTHDFTFILNINLNFIFDYNLRDIINIYSSSFFPF